MPELPFLKSLNLFSGLFSGFGSDGSAIGLSLGTTSVKLVELKKAGKAWKLIHFAMAQLPDDVIVNREVVNSLRLVETIKSVTSQLKLSSKSVCTGMSGNSLMIKRMTLDIASLKEADEQVAWEAEQYLPFDISEVVLDYQILSRSKEGKTDLILVAVKRSVLEGFMDSIEQSGLHPKIVDTDFFALQNLYETNYSLHESETVGIVDIGASSIKLVALQAGVPIFTRDSGLGGRNLTVEIQKSLNLSYEDAEALKIGGGSESGTPQEVSDLIQAMSESIANEIKKSIDFYNASVGGGPFSALFITGGSSQLPGLSNTIENICTLPVQSFNPFNSIAYDPTVFTQDYLESIAPFAAVPLGLAIRAGIK
ncbi:MAG: type IV pilus assembly protein PilM [Bdellovibrionia bacterium]